MARHRPRQPPMLEDIERRILYSADTPGAMVAAPVLQHAQERRQDQPAAEDPRVATELVFIDERVPDADALAASFAAQAGEDRRIEIVRIAADEDAIAAIGAALAGRDDVAALHLVSHGGAGQMLLGREVLDGEALLQRAGEIAAWGEHLGAEADILLYGCDVASTADGRALVQGLAALTGADVAASDDPTGAAALGGDWVLEQQVGLVQASALQALDWRGTLALTPVGGETLVNTTVTDPQQYPSVAVAPNGSYVAVWKGNGPGDTEGVFFQRYDAAGNKLGSETLVNTTTTGSQTMADVAMDAAGNFVIVWQGNGEGDSAGVFMRRFDASGNARDPIEQLVNTLIADVQSAAKVATDGAGNFTVVWTEPSDRSVVARRFGADGIALSDQYTVGPGDRPDIAMDASGNAIVTYQKDPGAYRIWGRLYDAAGTAAGAEFAVSPPGTLQDPYPELLAVARDATGFVAVWSDTGHRVMAQRFDASGVALGAAIMVHNDNGYEAYDVGVAMTGGGGFAVVWYSTGSDADGEIFLREYDGAGNALTSEIQVETSDGLQENPAIAFGAGQLVVLWNGTGPGDSSGIVSQRYTTSIGTATSVTVTTASDASPSSVTQGNASHTIDYLNNNRGADGQISLREAIIAANNTAAGGQPVRIEFDITGTGTHTITLASALPMITRPVILDASTEDSFAANGNRPAIILDGNGLDADGLVLAGGSSGSTIRGLVVRNFGFDAIQINTGSSDNTIAGNYIGSLTPTGDSGGVRNTGTGVAVLGANNIIGGTTLADRNVISGNANGVVMQGASASGNQVIGNYIGTDLAGTTAIANTFDGVRIEAGATGNTVGGSNPNQRNVLSGNGGEGVQIEGEATDGNTIRGNWIGVSADGATVLGNMGDGIYINGGADNSVIGGPGANDGNWIAGAAVVGIEIDGPTTGTLIQGNRIGTDLAGTTNWGVRQNGILIEDESGGAAPSNNQVLDNIVAFSGQDDGEYNAGIMIGSTAGAGNTLLRNVVYGSLGLGIDLGDFGVTPNDDNDTDTGPNNLQNFPVLTGAIVSGANTTVSGTLNSAAGTAFRIEFFSSPAGSGQGQVYLGFVNVTTTGAGNAAISATLAAVQVGHELTATATRSNAGFTSFSDTSEFSAPLAVSATDLVVTNTNDSGAGSLRQAILNANANAGTDTIRFAIPGNGVHQIILSSALPTITGTVMLDASTDDSFIARGVPSVILNGANLAASGLTLASTAGGSTIRGLVITNFQQQGILIEAGSNGNTIAGNYIGGVGADGGALATGVGEAGVRVEGANNIIGGSTALDRNVMSNAGSSAIRITGEAADGNIVRGNWIGVLPDGVTRATTSSHGITVISGGDNTVIGGPGANDGNWIVGTDGVGSGILVQGASTGTLIEGNRVGTDSTGSQAWSSATSGAIRLMDGAASSMIRSNILAFHGYGISLDPTAGAGNAFSANSIYGNSSLGIDLNADGVSGNDPGDTDTGPNNLQNFPVLTQATTDGVSQLLVSGTLNTSPGSYNRVEFFASPAAHASGYGEGRIYLGFVNLPVADGTGTATFSATLTGVVVPLGYAITATATRATNSAYTGFTDTSEFSQARAAVFSNVAPVLTTPTGTTNYTENAAAVPIAPALTVTDADSLDLTGAVVQITGGYLGGQDVLAFVDQNGITGNWNAATGILTLSGSATVARYQAALRSVTYVNTSDNPGTAARTLSFTVSDGTADSAAATRTLSVTAVDSAPVITTTAGSTSYTENAAAVAIDPTLTLGDADSGTLVGATVRIGTGYVNGQDLLAFTDQNGITASWDAATGTLTLSGTVTLALYEAALRSVTYSNSSDDPDTTTHVVSFQVNDGSLDSNVATRSLDVVAVNDAPVLATSGGTASYTENDAGVAIDPGLTVSDADSNTLASATVRIGTGYVNGQDLLAFTDQNGITASWDAATGTLTLTGSATVAQYEAALRSVTYRNSSDDPDTSTRVVSFQVNDGSLDSNVATRSLSVLAVNDAPVVATSPTALNTTEGAAAVAVDPGLTVSDIDSADLTGAVVQITGGYLGGQDVLAFVDQNGITGNWNAATGILTLSGSATVARYQEALRSVTYVNTSDNPGTAARTLSFTVSDGTADSAAATRTLSVTAVDSAPVITTTAGSASYTENAAAVVVDPTLTLGDADSDNLTSATVRIGTGYVNGQDVLGFTDQAGITGNWDAATGTLTLTGSAAMADYRAALRSVTYLNTSSAPNAATRTVAFLVSDGALNSAEATRDVALTAVNDAPVLTTTPGATAATEGAPAVAIDPGLTVSDADSATLVGATVRISTGYVNGQDVLGFTDQAGITGNWDAATGTLTLTGSAAMADYQAALRSVTYVNTSGAPITATRTVEFVVNDGALDSNVATRSLDVLAVNGAPLVATSGGTASYTENGAAVLVDPGLTVSDADSANLTGATVRISTGYVSGQDVLGFTDQAGITGNWDAATGTLTLTGSAAMADYRAALRSVTYLNTSSAPNAATRTVAFQVSDGALNSAEATRDVALTAVNDAPVLTTTPGATAATEGAPAVAIDPGLTVSDADSANLAGATVRIATGYVNGQDILTFVDQGSITGNWDAATGTLTLTGSAVMADYQAALRSVTYVNTSNAPNTATRTVAFQVSDGNQPSVEATRDVALTAVDNAPVLATTPGAIATAEGAPAVAVDPGLTVNDADSTNLTGATVRITTGYVNGQDVLGFTDQAGIVGSWDAATGTLTLTGSAAVADYQVALRSVTYVNTSSAPNTATRTIAFQVSDGALNSTEATRDVTLSTIDDAPVVGTSGGTASYTENDAGVTIDPGFTVSDADSDTLAGATVRITGNYVNGQDLLVFSNQNGITGSWNAATGTLTLSGTATMALYQDALGSVTYRNSSDDPDTSTRVVSFQVNDGSLDSNVATRSVQVEAVNDAPSGTSHTVVTQENAVYTFTAADFGFSDVDGNSLQAVRITTLPGAGSLRLGGVAVNAGDMVSLADIALTNLRFTPDTDADGAAYTSFTFQVQDDGGTANGGVDLDPTPRTMTIDVMAVNGAPVVASSGGTASYTENDAGVAIDPAFTVSDADSATLAGATVRIGSGYVNGQDELVFATQNGITGTWDAATGTLTLTGSAIVALYQDALRSVAYRNSSDSPDTSTRVVSFQVNDGSLDSNVATRPLNVVAVNDAPVLLPGAGTATTTEGAAPVAVAPGLTLQDVDNTTLAGATVRISANHAPGQDVLVFTDQSGITGNWNAATGTLTLTGSATVAEYQAALRSVRYQNTSSSPSTATRSVAFQVSDGALNSTEATRDVALNTTNNTPVVTTSGGTASYTEAATPVAVDPGLVVGDADDTTLTGATVRITANYVNGQDLLVFSNQNGITGSWNAATGTLTLTGGATVTEYQDALRSVTYRNSSLDPSALPRTVSFSVNDGSVDSTAATRQVQVVPVNSPPVITSQGGGATAAISVPENTLAVTTVTATDPDGPALSFSISGSDAALFTIDAATGVLRFLAAPDYENPGDNNADNVYNLVVAVTDGSLTTTQALTVTVTNVSDSNVGAVTDIDPAANSVPENAATGAPVGITARATDPDSTDTVSYSLSNNAGGRFTIHATTGVVTVANGALLDFESASSHGITVRATSSDGSFSEQAFTITLSDVSEQPVGAVTDINAAPNTVADDAPNGTPVGITARATDPNSTDAVSYSLSNNAGGRFTIDATTGVVTVANAGLLNGQAAASHSITIVATSADGTSSSLVLGIAVTVAPGNMPPAFPGSSSNVGVPELQLAVTTVQATDPMNRPVRYAIAASGDGAWFAIDANSGALRFLAPPRYDQPRDADGDNQYEVTVTAYNGSQSASHMVRVTVQSQVVVVPADPPVATPPPALPPVAEPPPAVTVPPSLPLPQVGQQPGDDTGTAGGAGGSDAAADPLTGAGMTPAAMAVRGASFDATVVVDGVDVLTGSELPAARLLDRRAEEISELLMLRALADNMEAARSGDSDSGNGRASTAAVMAADAFAVRNETAGTRVSVDDVITGGLAISLGAAFWASRGSAMVASLLAASPAWKTFDPLPVLTRKARPTGAGGAQNAPGALLGDADGGQPEDNEDAQAAARRRASESKV